MSEHPHFHEEELQAAADAEVVRNDTVLGEADLDPSDRVAHTDPKPIRPIPERLPEGKSKEWYQEGYKLVLDEVRAKRLIRENEARNIIREQRNEKPVDIDPDTI